MQTCRERKFKKFVKVMQRNITERESSRKSKMLINRERKLKNRKRKLKKAVNAETCQNNVDSE